MAIPDPVCIRVDLDCFVAGRSALRYYLNAGSNTFTEQTGAANPFNSVVCGWCVPWCGDLDNDGGRNPTD